jgi:hypothetical protein
MDGRMNECIGACFFAREGRTRTVAQDSSRGTFFLDYAYECFVSKGRSEETGMRTENI